MKALLLVLVLLLGCSTTSVKQIPVTVRHIFVDEIYIPPYIGRWAEQKENGRVRHWDFREDGTFEAISIGSAGGNKIIGTKRGAYDFGGGRYMLAYIHESRAGSPNVDITFRGPRPFIEEGTYDLQDGYLTLISKAGKTRSLYK